MSEPTSNPETQTDSDNLDLSDSLDLVDDVEMNEFGELEIRFKPETETDEEDRDGDHPSSDTEGDEEDTDSSSDDDQDADPDPDAPSDTWEGRYRHLQSHTSKALNDAYTEIQKLRESYAKLEGRLEGRGTEDRSDSATADDDDDTFEYGDEYGEQRKRPAVDPAAVLESLGLSPEEAAELKEALEERAWHKELTLVRQEVPDFDDYAPLIEEIVKSSEQVSFRQAYEIAKAASGGKPPRTPAPAADPGPPAPTANPDRRARREEKQRRLGLSPVSANTDKTVNRAPEINSPRDAIRAAFEEGIG